MCRLCLAGTVVGTIFRQCARQRSVSGVCTVAQRCEDRRIGERDGPRTEQNIDCGHCRYICQRPELPGHQWYTARLGIYLFVAGSQPNRSYHSADFDRLATFPACSPAENRNIHHRRRRHFRGARGDVNHRSIFSGRSGSPIRLWHSLCTRQSNVAPARRLTSRWPTRGSAKRVVPVVRSGAGSAACNWPLETGRSSRAVRHGPPVEKRVRENFGDAQTQGRSTLWLLTQFVEWKWTNRRQ